MKNLFLKAIICSFSAYIGKHTAVKRSWTPEECAAAERHLRRFIVMNQVPGKSDITAEPQALGSRDWKTVKYLIKNLISALRRK